MKYHYPAVSAKVAAVMALLFFFVIPMQVGAQKEYCSSSTGDVGNGYHYEYWSAGGGSACMTVYGDDARFKCNWSNAGDFLARVGLRYNETKTPDQIGIFSSDFAYTGSASGGLTYIGIYGWTNNPLVEYYIIDDWYSTWSSAPSIGTKKGTISLDTGVYFVYQNQRTGPSIHGNTTFQQYYSIRQKGRKSGHISISEHFAKWNGFGMPMGKLYEVKLLAEGMNNGSGNVDFTTATVVRSDSTGVSFIPVISRQQRPLSETNSAGGGFSLISLNGSAVGAVRMNGPEPAPGSTVNLPAGMYFLRFPADRGARVARMPLLR